MTFDHRHAGSPEKTWRECFELAGLPNLILPDVAIDIVVLAAHPDDETLGAGGLIALAAQGRHSIKVIVATDGERSHPDSTTHTPVQLAALRRAEATSAVRSLSPHVEVLFLGLPDGALDAHQEVIVKALRETITEGPVWLFAPWRKDRHPDHEACAAAAQTVADEADHVRLLEYPIWLWHWAKPAGGAWDQCLRLELPDDVQRLKSNALQAYASQMKPLSRLPGDEPVLSAGMLAHFHRPFETFIETKPQSAAAYFEEFHATHNDPWGLADRFYEKRKRQLLMSSLPRERFRRAFEPGCATGLLTEMLAPRCDQLLATDIAQSAVTRTQRRVARFPNVSVTLAQIPIAWPTGSFDLIVISEVGYYCHDLDSLSLRINGSLSADGIVLACHWRHPAEKHVHTAEAVHVALGAGLHPLLTHQEEDFLLDVWSSQPQSVARREGIIT